MFIAKSMEKSKPDCVIPPIPKILKFYPQNNLKITALQPERKSISKSYPKFRNKFAQTLKTEEDNLNNGFQELKCLVDFINEKYDDILVQLRQLSKILKRVKNT